MIVLMRLWKDTGTPSPVFVGTQAQFWAWWNKRKEPGDGRYWLQDERKPATKD